MEFKHLLDFMIQLKAVCHFCSIEKNNTGKRGAKVSIATNSELRRWFNANSVHVNGKPAKFDDPVPEVWESLVLFPKSDDKRCTLW